MAIVFFSGKLVGYLVDKYMFEGCAENLTGSDGSKMELLKGAAIAKHLGVTNIFSTEHQIQNQYSELKQLTEQDL